MQKIRVFDGYLVDPSHHIKRGVYDINDPALHGRGQYLLDNRHAEILKSPDDAVVEAAAVAVVTDDVQRVVDAVLASDGLRQFVQTAVENVLLATIDSFVNAEPVPDDAPPADESPDAPEAEKTIDVPAEVWSAWKEQDAADALQASEASPVEDAPPDTLTPKSGKKRGS